MDASIREATHDGNDRKSFKSKDDPGGNPYRECWISSPSEDDSMLWNSSTRTRTYSS
jgi:hypothetical protein